MIQYRTGGAGYYAGGYGVEVTQPSGIASFAGAYDAIPSITAAYGMRRLRSAYTGNLLRLRRSSDNAESNFGYVANGDLDTAAIATWLGANSGYVTTWYDQQGSKNATQATAASQPLYVASGQNGKSATRYDGTSDYMTMDAIKPAEISVMVARKINLHGAFINGLIDTCNKADFGTSVGWRMDVLNSQLRLGTNASFQTDANTSTAWHIQTGTKSDGSRSLCLDGVVKVSGTQSGVLTYGSITKTIIGNVQTDGAGTPGVPYLNGDIAEIVIASAAWSTAQRQAAESAANSYWGIF